jgi:hypothetical protein
MSTDKNPEEVARELAAWLDATEALEYEDRYVADAKGNCRRLLPPNASARQKLDWANMHESPVRRRAEEPVTLSEIEMSPEQFAKLTPARKLALANEAFARRTGYNRRLLSGC